MADIHIKSAARKTHALHHTQLDPYNQLRPHPKNRSILIPETYNVQNKHRIVARQAPSSTPPAATFLDGQTTDFKIAKGLMSTITHAYIQCKVSNTSASSCTVAPTPFWVEKLEILYHDSTILASLDSQELWLSLSAIERNEWEQLAGYMGSDNDYAVTGKALAAGASALMYLPVFSILTAAKLHLNGLENDIIIRLVTRAKANLTLAGTTPEVSEVGLILKGFEEVSVVKNLRQKEYASLATEIRLPCPDWVSVRDVRALQAGVSNTVQLKNLVGNYTGLFVTVRPSAITAANQGTYLAMRLVEIKEAGGSGLGGHYARTHEDFKIENAELFNNTFGKNSNWYFFSFCDDPAGDYGSGAVGGYQVFDGNQELTITPPAGFTSADYQIDVYGIRSVHLLIKSQNIARVN